MFLYGIWLRGKGLKFKVNKKSVDVIRRMPRELQQAMEEISKASNNALNVCLENRSFISPYSEVIEGALYTINTAIGKMAESVSVVSDKLYELADDYQAELDEVSEWGISDEGITKSGESDMSQDGAGTLSSDSNRVRSNAYKNDVGMMLVKKGYCQVADFGELDYRVVSILSERIEETIKEFPALNMKFVGSMQSRNIRMVETYRLTLQKARSSYKASYPTATEERIDQLIEEDVNCFASQLTIGDDTIAETILPSITQAPILDATIASYVGIAINEQYGADFDYINQVRRNNVATGFKPENCFGPQATVDHELGHMLDGLTGARGDREILELWDNFSGQYDMDKARILSVYAGKSIREFIAEAWCEYRNNPKCRELARKVAERIKKLYDMRFGTASFGGGTI